MPADPKLVRDLFLAAVELPATERAPYLAANTGGDVDVRAAVERLLAAHEEPASVLGRAVPRMPLPTGEFTPGPTTRRRTRSPPPFTSPLPNPAP